MVWLSCLALEIVLSGHDMLHVGVVRFLVVVIVVAGSNHDLVGMPLLSLFASLGAIPIALANSFGRCTPAAAEDHFPNALNEDGPDRFFTRNVLVGDVKQLLHGLQLIIPNQNAKISSVSPTFRTS
jgi:hypothetical protein